MKLNETIMFVMLSYMNEMELLVNIELMFDFGYPVPSKATWG